MLLVASTGVKPNHKNSKRKGFRNYKNNSKNNNNNNNADSEHNATIAYVNICCVVYLHCNNNNCNDNDNFINLTDNSSNAQTSAKRFQNTYEHASI